MSSSEVLVERQNSQFLQTIAMNIFSDDIENFANNIDVEELVNRILSQKFNVLNIYPRKTDSAVELEVDYSDDADTDDLWIFGYGSLVWKADFPFESRKTGYIEGFERKFYQNSIDHRGTAAKPGRVVTLIKSDDPTAKVYGVAYRIAKEKKMEVLEHLDYREKNGYQRYPVLFHPYSRENISKRPRELIIYIANEANDSYAGDVNDLEDITEQIYAAVGPSGTNREYVYKLANAMRLLFPGERDDHLFELERKLRVREQKELLLAESVKRNLLITIKNAIKAQLTVQEVLMLIDSEFENCLKLYRYK